MIGESPAISVIEFFVTAFDDLIWDDAENSIVTDLGANKVIGFDIQIFDYEGGGDVRGVYQMSDKSRIEAPGAEGFVDGLLIGAGDVLAEDSTVQADSWGRIKASLSD